MDHDPTTWRDMSREQEAYFEEGPGPAGYPDPVTAPPRLRRGGGVAPAPGTAHAIACTFFLRSVADPGRLVHGTIEAGHEPRHAHAWVELPEGLTWDGATRRFYPTAAWRTHLRPLGERAYTRTEAARLLLRTGHPGPWSDAERVAAGRDRD